MFNVISTIHQDGLPICSKGARRARNRQLIRMPKCQRLCGWGKDPPRPTLIGAHFNLLAVRLGNFRLPVVTVPIPCLGTPPHSWTGGWLRGSFLEAPQGLGEGQRCQPSGPPHHFCLQVSKQYIWGVPSAPTPDLSWRVWVSFSFSGKGWDRRGSWGFSEPLVQGGCGLIQGVVPY